MHVLNIWGHTLVLRPNIGILVNPVEHVDLVESVDLVDPVEPVKKVHPVESVEKVDPIEKVLKGFQDYDLANF